MDETESCLIAKLSHYAELDERAREQLAKLEMDEQHFERGTDVYNDGDPNGRLFVVKRGWLYSYIDLPDGRRQIVKIHHPGDVIGFPDIAYLNATTSMRSAEDCILCPFPKRGLDDIFTTSPRLTALLFSIALRDQTVLVDTIRAIGRMSAVEKISHMLLDLVCRLRITNKSMTDTFRLPLTQTEIADMVGLTNVYVSRTFVRLEAEGCIKRNGIEVKILEEDRMAALTDFRNRYSTIDTSWFPQIGDEISMESEMEA